VPTISIAYSVKAKGINRDLFGDTRLVLDTPAVSLVSLRQYLSHLESHEQEIRDLLAERIPEWRRRAAIPVQSVLNLVGKR
jgi:colanic acid/amylovoran biosynthesis protein